MMQDATHIRSLTGNQRLVTWKSDGKKNSSTLNNSSDNQEISTLHKNKYNITNETKIGSLVKDYPFLKDFLISLSPKFEKLKSPVLFKTMASLATLEMISERGNFEISDLISKLVGEIDRVNN